MVEVAGDLEANNPEARHVYWASAITHRRSIFGPKIHKTPGAHYYTKMLPVSRSPEQLKGLHIWKDALISLSSVFSTVVADGQFSTLGAVLLATLARLAKAIGIRKELKIPATTVGTSAFGSSSETTKEEDIGIIVSRARHKAVTPLPPDHCDLDDLGRIAYHKSTGSLPRGSGRCEETKMEDRIQKKKKKNRRKDAIDDLFDSLL